MSALQIRSAIERHAALLVVPLLVTPAVAVVVMIVSEPIETRLIWVALAAAAVGLLIGLLAVYLADRFDPIVHSARDLKAATGAPVLAVIPTARGVRGTRARPVVALDAPSSAYAERYRMLLAALDFANRDDDDRDVSDDDDPDAQSPIVLVASARQGERKTTTAANLAVTAARTGRRVVLVDGDLRSPQLHRVFELDDDVGLTSVVTRSAALQESVHRIDDLSKLMVMPVGPAPERPGEVLNDARLPTVVAAIARAADIVVIDAPPMLAAADAVLWAEVSDSVLVVATAGTSDQRELERVVDQLGTVRANVVGAVLHQPDPDVDGARAVSYGSRRATTVSNAPRDWFIAEGTPEPAEGQPGADPAETLGAEPPSDGGPPSVPSAGAPPAEPAAPSSSTSSEQSTAGPPPGADTAAADEADAEPAPTAARSTDVSVVFHEPMLGDPDDTDTTPKSALRPDDPTDADVATQTSGDVDGEGAGQEHAATGDDADEPTDDADEPTGDADGPTAGGGDDSVEDEPRRWPFPAPPHADELPTATDSYSWGTERTGGVSSEGTA